MKTIRGKLLHTILLHRGGGDQAPLVPSEFPKDFQSCKIDWLRIQAAHSQFPKVMFVFWRNETHTLTAGDWEVDWTILPGTTAFVQVLGVEDVAVTLRLSVVF